MANLNKSKVLVKKKYVRNYGNMFGITEMYPGQQRINSFFVSEIGLYQEDQFGFYVEKRNKNVLFCVFQNFPQIIAEIIINH